MKSMGWTTPFKVRPWPDIAARLRTIDAPECARMAALVDSIIACGDDRLAATTSMTDLIVVRNPVPEPPHDVLRVDAAYGTVRIWHQTHLGRDDRISRPLTDLIPLFWRFTIEKWGIEPNRASFNG